MTWRDKLGWPVELFYNRPITNFLRLLIHTSLWQTWKWRNGLPKSIQHLEGNVEAMRSPVSATQFTKHPDCEAKGCRWHGEKCKDSCHWMPVKC